MGKLAKDTWINTTRIRFGHESLDVTLAYLKGRDAESKKAQDVRHAAAWRSTHYN